MADDVLIKPEPIAQRLHQSNGNRLKAYTARLFLKELAGGAHRSGEARTVWNGIHDLCSRQTGEDGKRAVEIVQAAYLSNATGRTIELPLSIK